MTSRSGALPPPDALPPVTPHSPLFPLPRITTAEESSALDRETIARGTPSSTLMERAGRGAADLIRERYGRLATVVTIVAGPGNNGGDGWIVARALAESGARVRVAAIGEARTDDARAARSRAEAMVEIIAPDRIGEPYNGSLLVDALLGTGAHGTPRGELGDAVARLNQARADGASVVALDVPSGLDASTGQATAAVRASMTITFGTIKRGLLVARGLAGRIVLLDIGLSDADDWRAEESCPQLVDARTVFRWVPPIAADAHKGTRRKLVIVGGGAGMAGAPILAARSAMRSGAGMVRVLVARENLTIVQAREPHALAGTWPDAAASDDVLHDEITGWGDVLLIGPGLGHAQEQRSLVERLLRAWRGPVVLDADALNMFQGNAAGLAALLGGRAAIITPHAAEFARLAGCSVEEVLSRRFEIGAELARALRVTVLLKGVPTVVSDATGARLVSASGTPALAAAGSGDMLSGMTATLLGQMKDPLFAGACAAWVHGRAAEAAGVGHALRGISLDDVERALSDSWPRDDAALRAPLLAELPEVVER